MTTSPDPSELGLMPTFYDRRGNPMLLPGQAGAETETVDQDTAHRLEEARADYVKTVKEPVIEGAILSRYHQLTASPQSFAEARDAHFYFNAIADLVQPRLDADRSKDQSNDHPVTNTRIVELVGDEWENFNSELHERGNQKNTPHGSLRRLGGVALFGAEGVTTAVLNQYLHLGPGTLLLPAAVMGTTAALTRFRPDLDTVDKISPVTQDRGPVEEGTVKLLNELGLKDNATQNTMTQAISRWLKRNKPSKLRPGDTNTYDIVEKLSSNLTQGSDTEAFRVRAAVELTFASFEQAQEEALKKERKARNTSRLIVGGLAYAALVGAMYIHGANASEEIHPNKNDPSILEDPTPTNSGPDDGVTESPLEDPSESYFDDK